MDTNDGAPLPTSLAEVRPDLLAEWDYRSNDMDPRFVGHQSRKSATWICAEGHAYKQTIDARVLFDRGCKICSGSVAIPGVTDFGTEHPHLLPEWDVAANTGVDRHCIPSLSRKRVSWICAQGHRWEAIIRMRTVEGRGCPACINRRLETGFNDLATVDPDNAALWDHSRNGKLTPETVRSGSIAIVHWICTERHTWSSKVTNRVKGGKGCPFCNNRAPWPGFNDLATTFPHIAAEWDYERNAQGPSDVLPGGAKPVWWVCEGGHQWEASPRHRTRRGAPGCSRCKADARAAAAAARPPKTRGTLMLADHRPDLVTQWHPTLNDRSPAEVPVGSSYVATWYGCDRNPEHTWQYEVKARVRLKTDPYACGVCNGAFAVGVNDLATTHPSIARQWVSAPGGATPEAVQANSQLEVEWTGCPTNPLHVWHARVVSRTKYATGCKVCTGQEVQKGVNDLATLEPELASQWHLTLNAQGPDQFTRVAEAKVWWRCEYGHDWETKICSRTYSGSGCSVCSNLVVLKGFNDLATTHPHLVDEWDAAANDMTPDSVVFGSNYKASWVCARGHSWMAKVATRTGGYKSGCPVCGTTTSKPEEVMRVALGICTPSVALLESHCLLPLPWRKRKHLRVDSAGFLASDPSMPFVCEYDGAYFHRREDDVKRDIEKTVILLDAGYTVVRIREQAKNLPLPALPLQHPRLLQIDFKVPYGAAAQNQMDEVMKGTAQRIEEWVLANTSEARHRG